MKARILIIGAVLSWLGLLNHSFVSAQPAQELIEGDVSLCGLRGVEVITEKTARFDPADKLSSEIIDGDVKKRLRDAGVNVLNESTKEDGNSYLHVDIDYWKDNDGTFVAQIELKFEQDVTLDRNPSIKLKAITWLVSRIVQGEASKISESIKEALGELVDHFVSDYKFVRENPSLCKQRRPTTACTRPRTRGMSSISVGPRGG